MEDFYKHRKYVSVHWGKGWKDKPFFVTINWSALGDVSVEEAKEFLSSLQDAISFAESLPEEYQLKKEE